MNFQYRGALKAGDPLFQGRVVEMNTLVDACRAATTKYYVVYGSRQSGKTSLLLHLRPRLLQTPADDEEDKVYPCWVDFQRVAGDEYQATLRFIAGQVVASVPALKDYPVPRTFEEDDPLFDTWLRDLPFKGRIVLLMEELGALPENTRRDLGSRLRGMFDQAPPRVNVILFGGIDLFTLAWQESSPLNNVCDKIYLPDLSEAESRRVLAIGFGIDEANARSQTFESMAQAIYRLVNGHPYLTQRLGELALQYSQESGNVADKSMIETLAARLLEADNYNDNYFGHLFETITRNQLVPACRHLLYSPRYSALTSELEKIRQLGIAKTKNDRWIVRNPLLEQGLRLWLEQIEQLAPPTVVTNKIERAHLQQRYGELQERYDLLTRRMGALNADIAMSGSITNSQPLEERYGMLNEQREKIVSEMTEIEKKVQGWK